MSKIPRSLIALVVIGLLIYIIWPKVHIVVWVPVSFGQAIITFGVAALVLFLLVDHLLNRRRG